MYLALWATKKDLLYLAKKIIQKSRSKNLDSVGQVWWLIPVTSAVWEAEVVNPLSPGVQDQPGQHGETPSLQKNTKISWA